MRFKIPIVITFLGVASTSISQDFIYEQGDSAGPAPGNRLTVRAQGDYANSIKTEAQIESEVVRYLAVQLTSANIASELMAFLGIGASQVDKILEIIKPLENHHLQLEIERMAALCGKWDSFADANSNVERFDVSLNAYEDKLIDQRNESTDLYRNAISQIAEVLGPQNREAWEEYLKLQRGSMSRSVTTYFHQNVISSLNPSASIESLCGGN